jgi:hypothetical protein
VRSGYYSSGTGTVRDMVPHGYAGPEFPSPSYPGQRSGGAESGCVVPPACRSDAELQCIEGWSVPVHCAGARFADFAERYKPATRDGSAPDLRNKPEALVPYVSLETPDGDYYVGLDMAAPSIPRRCFAMK